MIEITTMITNVKIAETTSQDANVVQQQQIIPKRGEVSLFLFKKVYLKKTLKAI